MTLLGEKIGTGSSCEVYEWGGGSDKVVKLYHAGTPPEEVTLEYRNSLAAWSNGAPAARPFELTTAAGRPGIVFEKIVGPTFIGRFFEQLVAFRNTDEDETDDGDLLQFARVLHAVHQAPAGGIETKQKERLRSIIGRPAVLTDEETAALRAYIDRLPAKRQLCHGDTNVGNLILANEGPVLIDWMHASVGNPAADVAEVCVTILFAVLPPEIPAAARAFFESKRQGFYRSFLDEYRRLSGVAEEEIRDWFVPMAARQIVSGALQEEQVAKLAELIRSRL